MISPVGFTSVYSLRGIVERKHRELIGRRWQRIVWLHNQLHAVPRLMAVAPQSDPVVLPKLVLSRLNEYYAFAPGFINPATMTISLELIRMAAYPEPSIRDGMFMLEESFMRYPGYEIAEMLEPLEGWSLVVEDAEAEAIVARIADGLPKADARPLTKAQTNTIIMDYVASFGPEGKATRDIRENWAMAKLGLPRPRVRELFAEFAPAHWHKPGRQKKH
jgi:hypothetical protein